MFLGLIGGTTGGGVPTGGGGAETATGVPQVMQNFTPALILAPQDLQTRGAAGCGISGFLTKVNASPHLPQKRASGFRWLPQWMQKFMAKEY